jgi:hypothetical protein
VGVSGALVVVCSICHHFFEELARLGVPNNAFLIEPDYAIRFEQVLLVRLNRGFDSNCFFPSSTGELGVTFQRFTAIGKV